MELSLTRKFAVGPAPPPEWVQEPPVGLAVALAPELVLDPVPQLAVALAPEVVLDPVPQLAVALALELVVALVLELTVALALTLALAPELAQELALEQDLVTELQERFRNMPALPRQNTCHCLPEMPAQEPTQEPFSGWIPRWWSDTSLSCQPNSSF